MRLKVALVAVAAAVLLALAPYTVEFLDWRYDPQKYAKIVHWAQCHAEVVEMPERPAVASFYSPLMHQMYLGTQEASNEPYYTGLFIVFHETGHCLQHEQGWLEKQSDIVVVELDADRRAADLACGMGLDGRGILVDTFEWAHRTFGYNGDPDHGSLEQREAQAANAHVCDKVAGQ